MEFLANLSRLLLAALALLSNFPHKRDGAVFHCERERIFSGNFIAGRDQHL
jgi:hypothetical protein